MQEVQTSLTWMKASLYRVLGFGFGAGLIKKAPGTWGTLVGWFLWWVLSSIITSDIGQAVLILLCFGGGIYICQRVSDDLGVKDYGGIVWDEIVAFFLVLFFVDLLSFSWQLFAFGLFRFFDIVKPWPIAYFDERFKNGFGVMWDDIIAALYTLFVLAIAVRIVGML